MRGDMVLSSCRGFTIGGGCGNTSYNIHMNIYVYVAPIKGVGDW